MTNYNNLVHSFRADPREIPTAPINGSIPKWFYVYEHQDEVYISSGKEHPNACRVNPARKLSPEEFPVMLDLYQRRISGEHVSREAAKQSMNQSYWFGIMKELY